MATRGRSKATKKTTGRSSLSGKIKSVVSGGLSTITGGASKRGGGRRHHRRGAYWYAKEIQRLKLKRKYNKIRFAGGI